MKNRFGRIFQTFRALYPHPPALEFRARDVPPSRRWIVFRRRNFNVPPCVMNNFDGSVRCQYVLKIFKYNTKLTVTEAS